MKYVILILSTIYGTSAFATSKMDSEVDVLRQLCLNDDNSGTANNSDSMTPSVLQLFEIQKKDSLLTLTPKSSKSSSEKKALPPLSLSCQIFDEFLSKQSLKSLNQGDSTNSSIDRCPKEQNSLPEETFTKNTINGLIKNKFKTPEDWQKKFIKSIGAHLLGENGCDSKTKSKLKEINKGVKSVPVLFQGHLMTLQVHKDPDSNRHQFLVVPGQFKKDAQFAAQMKDQVCLNYAVDHDHKLSSIHQIASGSTGCGLPDKNKGNFILELTDSLNRCLGVKTSALKDDSKVKCGDQTISLAFQRTMEKGESWYQSHDFMPTTLPSKDYTAQMKTLREFPISKAIEVMNNQLQEKRFFPTQQKKDDFLEKLKIFETATQTSQAKTFGELFSFLRVHECKNYSQINDLLFTGILFNSVYPWRESFNTFTQHHYQLEKTYK